MNTPRASGSPAACVLCGNRREDELAVHPRPLPTAALREAARSAGHRDYTYAVICDQPSSCVARWPTTGPLG